MDMMLQPPRGREVSFYEWEGRGEEKGGRRCADASVFSFIFSEWEGRTSRGGLEMRRLHFYEWGGHQIALRTREARIFMNGKKWQIRRVRLCVGKKEGWGLFFGDKDNVIPDLHIGSTFKLIIMLLKTSNRDEFNNIYFQRVIVIVSTRVAKKYVFPSIYLNQ